MSVDRRPGAVMVRSSAPRRPPTPTPLRHVARLLACVFVELCVAAPIARAADCVVVESRASLAALSGTRISSIVVLPDGPSLPGLARLGVGLHHVTREGTIRRQLLFAPGDTVDTLRVGETMRRLRQQRLFGDVVLLAERCDGSDAVGLVLRTRDSWTLRPTARLRASNALSVGVAEKNLLGTGRTIAVTNEMSRWGHGAGVTLVDPWLFGSDVEGSVRLARLGGAHIFRMGLQNHEYSVLDRWRAEGSVLRLTFADTGARERTLHSLRSTLLVGRRISAGGTSVTMLLAGAEFDSAAALSPTQQLAANAPPGTPHVRSFLGADVGLLHRTAQYDTASWIVPGRGFLDVPIGWEGEGVLGAGYRRDADVPALKLDAWMGRVWMPVRGRLLTVDGWASGYAARGVDANHVARVSAGWYQSGWHGLWSARVTAERLLELDPDLLALSQLPLSDYTAPVVRPHTLRAGRTVAGSIERSVNLVPVGATSVLAAGAFVAGSYRWQVRGVPGGQLRAGVAGARFRLLSAHGGVNTVRVDVGYPVMLSDVLPRHGFAVITVGTLFDVTRYRDGRR